MTYRILLSPGAKRALESQLPERMAAAIWSFISGPLSDNPRQVGKPLRGELEGRWSARRGQYRVVYSIDEDVIAVVVIRVAHRSTIYR